MIKSKFMNLAIKKKILIIMLLVALIPLISLGVFSTNYVAKTVLNMKSEHLQEILDQVNINTFLKFKNIDDISKTVLSSPAVKQILINDQRLTFQERYVNTDIIEKELKSISLNNDYISSIYLLPERYHEIYAVGDVVASYNTSYFDESFQEYKKLEIYENTIADVLNYRWWPIEDVQGRNVFALSRKLYDVEEGNLGVVVIHVDSKLVRDIYKRINLEYYSELFLVSNDGTILYTNREEEIGDKFYSQEIINLMYESPQGNLRTTMNRDAQIEDVMIFHNTFLIADWKIFVITPYDKVISEATLIRNVSFAYLGISLILIIIIANIGSLYIVRPILNLVDKMKQGSKGELEIRVKPTYMDEIGVLGESFNKMMFDINRLINEVESEHQQNIEAEIRILEAHINPHFLYNTLSSIYWTALADGNQVVADMANSLSNYFRLGLNRGKEFTTIQNEISHVREYLQIQKMRFSDKLSFSIDCHPSIHKFQTIKLLLQPLVENSIIHGFDDMKEKGEIQIKAYQENNYIVFVVNDNGKGLVNSKGEMVSDVIEKGYGLKNIWQRLSLYYDNDFLFTINNYDNVTIAKIMIPAISE